MDQLTVSLWGDEAFASILAQKNLFEIVTIVARDTSPPLHYILLHFWMQLFGKGEIAIRAFPIFLFLLLAFVVYRMARDIFNKKVARFAAVLTLFNPFLFVYAFEARMYMLLVLTATASMWFFITRRWLLYVLATTASLYTHHFSIFIIFVQIIYYIITNYRLIINKPLQIIKEPFIRSLIGIIALYLPWLPALYGQTTMVAGDFWLARPSIFDLRDLFYHFVIGFTKVKFETALLFLAAIILILRNWTKKDFILVLWIVLPAIITYLLSQVSRPVFFDRYLIVSVAAVPILLSSGLKRVALFLLSILLLGLAAINIFSFQHPVKQPFREVAQFIYSAYNKEEMVVNYYTNALHYFELKHYDVNVKIYSPTGPLPFWVGTALIDKNDILTELPRERILLIMASGDIGRIKIPGYQEVRRKQFRDLYLLWFFRTS